jgi:hypothetical protein
MQFPKLLDPPLRAVNPSKTLNDITPGRNRQIYQQIQAVFFVNRCSFPSHLLILRTSISELPNYHAILQRDT